MHLSLGHHNGLPLRFLFVRLAVELLHALHRLAVLTFRNHERYEANALVLMGAVVLPIVSILHQSIMHFVSYPWANCKAARWKLHYGVG